jgi:hypothetical protein
MAYNYKDPRFQRAILTANRDPRKTGIGESERVTSNFVNQQQGVANQLAQLGLNKKAFASNMSLSKKRLKFRQDATKQGIQDAKSANKLGILGGLGTTLLAGSIGRQRRKVLEAETAQRLAILERMEAKYGGEE